MNRTTVEALESRHLLSLAVAGPEIGIPGMSGADRGDFDMDVEPDGKVIVVCRTHEGRVLAVRYDADGRQSSNMIEIAPSGADVSVSVNDAGDAVVAYVRPRGVYFVRLSSDNVVSDPTRIAAGVVGVEPEFLDTAASIDPAGRFFVGWTRRTTPGDDAGDKVFARSFDAAGSPRDHSIEVLGESVSTGGANAGELDLAALPDGSGAAFSYVIRSNATSFVNYGHTTTGRVFQHKTIRGSGPDVSVYGDGGFALVYNHDVAGNGVFNNIGVRQLNANLSLRAQPLGIANQPTTRDRASIDTTADGGFVVAFRQRAGDADEIHLRLYDEHRKSQSVIVSQVPQGAATTGIKPVVGASDDLEAIEVAYQHPGAFGSAVNIRRAGVDGVEVINGQLFINSSDAGQDIRVSTGGGRIITTIDSVRRSVNQAGVTDIFINGHGGGDLVISNTPIPTHIDGGEGNDTVVSGSGDDRINGGDGDDILRGGDGHDRVFGDAGDDHLYGDLGHDRLYGLAGNDILLGDEGRDSLYGGADSDTLFGQSGNDHLDGESGTDDLHGGENDDLLISADSGRIDKVLGGAGFDTADADEVDVLVDVEVKQ